MAFSITESLVKGTGQGMKTTLSACELGNGYNNLKRMIRAKNVGESLIVVWPPIQ